jgi:hypothetical protein
MNPLEAMALQKEQTKELYLPKNIELAVNLINAFIKNNNILGLKIAILLSGAKEQIEYDKDNKVYFDVDELCNLLKIDKRTLSRQLLKSVETHFTYVTQEGNVGKTTPIHSYEYFNKNKKIWFEVSSKAKELFTELGKGQYQFTKAISENLMDLKHKHSLRMQLFLEMINNYSPNVAKRKKMTLEEINGYFGTNYRSFYEFEKKILEPVKAEISTSNKLTFDYDFQAEKNQGTGRPKFEYVVIDVVDNSESLFAQ